MKKILTFILVSLMFAVVPGCEKESDSDFKSGKILDADSKSIQLPPEGGELTIFSNDGGFDYFSIKYNGGTLHDENLPVSDIKYTWLTASALKQNDAGRYTELTISAETNDTDRAKSAYIQVYRLSDRLTEGIQVIQNPMEDLQ